MNSRFATLAVCSFLLLAVKASAAEDSSQWHIQYVAKQRVLFCEVLNRYSPRENVREYFPYAVIPPELAQQRRIQTRFAINGRILRVVTADEHSAYHRPILTARIPATTPADQTNITVTITYETTLYSRKLKPGAVAVPVADLSPAERMLALRESKWSNFTNAEFSSWLRDSGLIRQPQENLIAFGRRVEEFVHEHMTYAFPSPTEGKPLTQLCQVLKGHCGHYAMLFVGIMRANGIPARELVGNWVNTNKKHGHGDPHIKAEYFVRGIGWVPVDANQGQFGREDGNFLTYHLYIEPLGVPSPGGGTWWTHYFQGIYLPCAGGSWDKPTWNHWFTETPVELSSTERLSSGERIRRPAGKNLAPLPDVYLGELSPIKAKIGWGSLGTDHSVSGHPLAIGGWQFEHGIGTHAYSELVYDLRPEYQRFVAVVGVDDEMSADSPASVVFKVFFDDHLVKQTPLLRPDQPMPLNLPIPKGSSQIRLVVTDGGDGANSDHADWCHAGFITSVKEPQTDSAARLDWGQTDAGPRVDQPGGQ
jgi:transglutaminase-like putative cysteine protease